MTYPWWSWLILGLTVTFIGVVWWLTWRRRR